MTSEHIYRCCCTMACELLQGLEARDLHRIEESLNPLRETLAARHCFTGSAFDSGSLLWIEQLDLLEGITESVEAAVEAIRRSSQQHFLRMQTAESLLRHLVGENSAVRHINLPVC